MRRFLLAAAMFGAAAGARAADMPDLPILRGGFAPEPATRNWEGWYFGGQGAYGSSDENFNGSTRTMVAALLANTRVESEMQVSQWNLGLGKASARTSAFGAFGGYTSQWDDVILGVEASYLHGGFGGTATAVQARVSSAPLSDQFFHDVKATSSASISISDVATFRGRAGYAYGGFLPYVFAGLALGNADIRRSVKIEDTVSSATFGSFTLAPLTSTDVVHNHLVYGYSAGLGIDVALVGGLFLRAEWEYIRFTASVDTSVNTVHAGLGYKF